MIELIFWLSLLVLMYAFIGYPLILKVAAAVMPRHHDCDGSFEPHVSIVLSVYNEEAVIRQKINNFLALDYTKACLEMVIVSDMCSDRTEEIVRSFDDSRIKLMVQERRNGKTRNLNRAVTAATGDILVFTDANSMFAGNAVRCLVQHFSDPRIGLVSGRSVYIAANGNNEQLGGAYRRYEEMIKEAESSFTSIVGADGAIYALRKSLYKPLHSKYINDLIHTIQVVLSGYHAISDKSAICREIVEDSYGQELERQTRIMAQAWLIYLSQAGKLVTSGRLLYFWALTSHKLFRWLTIPLMIALFVTSIMLLKGGLFYQCLFTGQVLFILLALFGGKLKSGLMRMPHMFMLLYFAAVLGLIKYMSGNFYTTWSPREG